MVFWSDNDKDTRITIEEMDDIMKEMNREERKAFAEDQKLRCMIRDYKTAADPRKIWYEIKEYGDTKTGYVFSMAFYYLIVWARYGVKSEVCLDVIKSKSNFLNYTHHIPSEIMVAKMNTITGVIDSIVEAEKTEERGTITIQDIFDGNKLSNYYSLLAPHMSSSRIVEDVYMG
jgi:benzoyl-CoA reductase/2-hydroxyglutaryl-CoA dehydratase subunit BcrC/BadD/HgdB